jgi:hypothetical protein
MAIGIADLILKSKGSRGSTRTSALAGMIADPTIVGSASEGSVNARLPLKRLNNYLA